MPWIGVPDSFSWPSSVIETSGGLLAHPSPERGGG